MATAQTMHEVPTPSTKIQPNAQGLLECPECHETNWKHPAGLGVHRQRVHGIRGSHPQSLRIHRNMQAVTKVSAVTKVPASLADIKMAADGTFHCPQCAFSISKKGLLGSHMRTRHGIKDPYYSWENRAAKKSNHRGTATHVDLRTTRHVLTSDIKKRNGKFHCPECKFSTSTPRVLGRHRSFKHGVVGTSVSAQARMKALQIQPARRPDTNGNINDHSPTIISPQDEVERDIIFCGGVETGRLQILAESKGIPFSVLASGVGALIQLSAGGRGVGPLRRVPSLRREATS